MIFLNGDIFSSKMQTITNTINTKSVMGKGLALEFKKRYPEMFQDYVEKCKAGLVKVGQPYLYDKIDPWILNFPTKDDWRWPSKYIYIESGLEYLVDHIEQWKIRSLAIPALGCTNGGLDWNRVKGLIEKYLKDVLIDIEVYQPFN